MTKTYAIGIDMGNNITSIGIVDTQGNIINKSSVNSNHQHINEYIDSIYNHLSILIEQQGGIDNIKGVGISSPDGNYFTGCVEFAPEHSWSGNTPIAQILADKLQLPVTLTNGANAAAMGEMEYGIAQGMKDFILISLDDEVCRGAVANGEIIYGHNIFSGKSGHINVHNDRGRVCKCGRKDCLEAYCSTDGIIATALELLTSSKETSTLRNIPQNQLTFENIYEASIQGDSLAKEAFRFTGDILGQLLSDLIAYSSPKAFILSGKVAKSNEHFIQAIEKSFEDNLLQIYAGKTKILTSDIENSEAIILGTSLLACNAKLVDA